MDYKISEYTWVKWELGDYVPYCTDCDLRQPGRELPCSNCEAKYPVIPGRMYFQPKGGRS